MRQLLKENVVPFTADTGVRDPSHKCDLESADSGQGTQVDQEALRGGELGGGDALPLAMKASAAACSAGSWPVPACSVRTASSTGVPPGRLEM